MDKRTTGIIVTLITVILCGCPGLFGMCLGTMFALISFIPGAKIDIFGNHEPQAALNFGLVVVVISLVFIAIPVVAGIITLRTKKKLTPIHTNEPIPPAL